MIGIIVLIASLIGSKVDQLAIEASELADFGEAWQVDAGGKAYADVRLPSNIGDPVHGGTIVLEKNLPAQIQNNTNLFFRASHQKVKVLIGGSPVYSFGWDEQRLFGKTPASTWVIIPLTEAENGASVRIELTGVYERYTNKVNEIYIGDKSAIIHEIVNKRAGSLLICMILMILGAGMLAVSTILRSNRITASLLRLGVLSLLVGIWSTCVTNSLQIFYGNVFVLLNFEFFVFDLLLPVFIWFLLSFQHYREQKWLNWFFWASVIEFLLIEILQVTGIADYMESIIITHAMIAGVMGCIIGTGIRDLFQRHATREEKIFLVTVLMLMTFAGIDLVRFYQVNIMDEGFYTRIGTLLFVALWALEVIKSISRQFVNMAKTEVLEVLAYEDLMTGLKNRTAFEERLNTFESTSDSGDAYIIAFDMNGLKEINDKYGHMRGDQAIIAIARIIKEAFENGTCYRTGGDEICVILTGSELLGSESLQEILQKIETAIDAESKALNTEFSVAAGYSKASLNEKKDIYHAYREADRRMYACKHKMKGQREANEFCKGGES
jgi:diguanylate cyclase (GGDEF)-like protein